MFATPWRRENLWITTVILSASSFIACQSSPSPAATQQQAAQDEATARRDPIERGRKLVVASVCADCHTPLKMAPNGPAQDQTMWPAGHPEGVKMPPPPTLPEGPWQWVGAGTNTAFAGLWGVTYEIKLTPDRDTGLGILTEDMFVNALRTGKHFGTSRPIMPPMPWPNYAQMEDDELKAIFAYLRSIKPIKNRVPDYQPPAGATN